MKTETLLNIGAELDEFELKEELESAWGYEAWLAESSEKGAILLRIVTDPEVQIILREQSVLLEDWEGFSPPEKILPLTKAAAFGEPPFLAEPHAEGHVRLRHLLDAVSPLPIGAAISYFSDVLEALAALHEAEKAHGAICPQNIFLDKEGGAHVGGLGWGKILATIMLRGLVPYASQESNLTVYLAPEQRNSAKGFGPPADVYGAAVLMHELVTGQLPSKTEGDDDEGEDVKLRALAALPEALQPLFKKATSQDAEERYNDAGEFLEAWTESSKPLIEDEDQTVTAPDTFASPEFFSPELIDIEGGDAELPIPSPMAKREATGDLARTVAPFRLAKYPVTAQAFCLFLDNADPDKISDYFRPSEFTTIEQGEDGLRPRAGMGHLPANGVSQEGASAYAEWLSEAIGEKLRLPSLEEWLTAAGSAKDDTDPFPWGVDEPTEEHSCFDRRIENEGRAYILPTDSTPNGAAINGLMALNGYVGEWTTTTLQDYLAPEAEEGEKLPDEEEETLDLRKEILNTGREIDGVIVHGCGWHIKSTEDLAVVAGGSWYDSAQEIQSRRPVLFPKHFRRLTMGFRLAADAAEG